MLIDYGVFKLFAFDWALDAPKALRIIALILAVAGLGALVVTKIIIRLTRDFSDSSLALVLEKRFPKILGDRLITAVQLSDLEVGQEVRLLGAHDQEDDRRRSRQDRPGAGQQGVQLEAALDPGRAVSDAHASGCSS